MSGDESLVNLSGVWVDKNDHNWKIIMIGNFYSIEGLDFGPASRKATGVFNDEGKALTQWWENGVGANTLIVTIYDENTLQLSNGDVFRKIY